MPEVDRRLAETGRYEIDWNRAFGGTVAKTGGVLEALQYGLADIGIITSPFHPDKIPFYNISYVTPLVTADIGLVARTVDELVERYPQLRQEWSDYNQVFLTAAGAIDTYQVLMNEPIETLDDFRGKKICGVGLNLRYVQGLGSAAVSSNLGDFYNNIATGLTEGTVAWAEAAVAYKLYEVAPYMIDVRLGAVTSKVISVNERSWARLPEEVRQVLRETAVDYRDELARETDRLRAVQPRGVRRPGRDDPAADRRTTARLGGESAQHGRGMGGRPRRTRAAGPADPERLHGHHARPRAARRAALGPGVMGANPAAVAGNPIIRAFSALVSGLNSVGTVWISP